MYAALVCKYLGTIGTRAIDIIVSVINGLVFVTEANVAVAFPDHLPVLRENSRIDDLLQV